MNAKVVPYSWALKSPIFWLVCFFYYLPWLSFPCFIYLLLFLHIKVSKKKLSLKFSYTCCFLLLLVVATGSLFWMSGRFPNCHVSNLILIFLLPLILCMSLFLLLILWLIVYNRLLDLFFLTCILFILSYCNNLRVTCVLSLNHELTTLFLIFLGFSFCFTFLPFPDFSIRPLNCTLLFHMPLISCNTCSSLGCPHIKF